MSGLLLFSFHEKLSTQELTYILTSSLPDLASSTGVGFWRLSSSVCHIEVISLTYQTNMIYENRREVFRKKESHSPFCSERDYLPSPHSTVAFQNENTVQQQYQVFNHHFSIFRAKIRSIVVIQKMLHGRGKQSEKNANMIFEAEKFHLKQTIKNSQQFLCV